MEFNKPSKKASISIGVALVLVVIVIGCRVYNANKNKKAEVPDTDIIVTVTATPTPEPTPTITSEGDSDGKFSSPVGVVEVTEAPTPTPVVEVVGEKREVYLKVTGSTKVPDKNMDGSSYHTYVSGITIKDFPVYWGSSLTEQELRGSDYVLVGTEQLLQGDLRSVGWLIKNLSSLDKSCAVYFTNLNVITSMTAQRTALLCSYSWYSANGLQDTMVLLEDISGTTQCSDFKEGDIISTVVYAKNIRVEKVNGQNVVCIQYATED